MNKECVVIEKKRGYFFSTETKLLFTDKLLENNSYSCVRVNKLPIPETIKAVNLKGDNLSVLGVTASGLVVLDDNDNSEDYEEITVTFQEAELPIKKEIFNTIKGISNYVHNLKSLNEVIEARSIYGKIYEERLTEFVFDRIVLLDSFGQAFILGDMDIKSDKFYQLEKVVYLDKFRRTQERYSFGGKYVPLFTEKCDQCGETYTLEDLPYLSTTWYSRKLMHNGCIGHHYYETERAIFENILKKVYPNKDYSLKGIKTKYIYDDKTRHNRPWFKVQTPDGEILIGKRKRVFHIEWKDSYKLFSETFESEDVTKEFNKNDNKRYIHAYSIDNTVKYLKLAKKSIEK